MDPWKKFHYMVWVTSGLFVWDFFSSNAKAYIFIKLCGKTILLLEKQLLNLMWEKHLTSSIPSFNSEKKCVFLHVIVIS